MLLAKLNPALPLIDLYCCHGPCDLALLHFLNHSLCSDLCPPPGPLSPVEEKTTTNEQKQKTTGGLVPKHETHLLRLLLSHRRRRRRPTSPGTDDGGELLEKYSARSDPVICTYFQTGAVLHIRSLGNRYRGIRLGLQLMQVRAGHANDHQPRNATKGGLAALLPVLLENLKQSTRTKTPLFCPSDRFNCQHSLG